MAAHHAAFTAMAQLGHAGAADLAAALEEDLGALDWPLPAVPVWTGTRPDPLALRYIAAGSRMGTQVLARRWSKATDPAVRAANRYFLQSVDVRAWQMLCRTLDDMDGTGARADRIVADTRRLFDLFARCAEATATDPCPTEARTHG